MAAVRYTRCGLARAIELFLQAMVDAAVQETQKQNAKKIVPAHLKHAFESIDKFDFLRDLVADIADAQQQADARKKAK